jgi:hypothetical protein
MNDERMDSHHDPKSDNERAGGDGSLAMNEKEVESDEDKCHAESSYDSESLRTSTS